VRVVSLTLAATVVRFGVVHAQTPPPQGVPKPAQPAPQQSPPGTASDPTDALTTPMWRAPGRFAGLHRAVLAAPEYAVELAFSPLALVVDAVETYRLDRRIYDLLRNDDGTIVLTPAVKISGGDGFGLGGTLSLQALGATQRLDLGAVARFNRDLELGARYRHAFASAEGRELDVRVHSEIDRNVPFFGLGNDTPAEQHVLRAEFVDVSATFDLTDRSAPAVSAAFEAGLLRSFLGTGSDSAAPGEMDGSRVPGFGETITFPRVRFAARFDSRDNIGRPTRGYRSEVTASYTQDLSQAGQSAMAAGVHLAWHIPVLPDRRTVSLAFGVAGATPLRATDEVPFHELVTLGRRSHLRGYSRGRFRDQLGWWSSAEYQFPIWEYINSGVALTPGFFFDLGRVGRSAAELVDGPLRYSGGIALHAAHDSMVIFRLQVGVSPEGPELDFSLGKEL
jgi:hypothetical protein